MVRASGSARAPPLAGGRGVRDAGSGPGVMRPVAPG